MDGGLSLESGLQFRGEAGLVSEVFDSVESEVVCVVLSVGAACSVVVGGARDEDDVGAFEEPVDVLPCVFFYIGVVEDY